MKTELYVSGRSITVDLDNTCPFCGRGILPEQFDNGHSKKISPDVIRSFMTLYCPVCAHVWVNEYDVSSQSGHLKAEKLTVHRFIKSDIAFPKNIQDISPIGHDIYLQALEAEKLKLNYLVGIGYRKALEFLVKDFSIFLNPKDQDKIERMPLKQVLTTYITDEELRVFGLAANYIGNDEAHYIRKNTDRDLSALKTYLHGFIYYMNVKLHLLDAQDFVNPKP